MTNHSIPAIHPINKAAIARLLLLLLFVSISSVYGYGSATNVENGLKQGAVWPDNNGNHVNAHGGCVIKHNGKYYWYGEQRPVISGESQDGVSCYSSEDLTTWRREGLALAVNSTPGDDLEKGCVIERPKVVYNKTTGKFVMWFHLELKGKGYEAARYGVAVADNPAGPFTFLRSGRVNPKIYPLNLDVKSRDGGVDKTGNYEWWTPEWTDAVKNGLFVNRDFDGGQMSRDMTIFVDDDGRAYHIYSSEENLTLHIAELTDDYLNHTGKYIRVAPGGHNEAPMVTKRDGKYWMITSGCTGWAPNEARMFSADSIMGQWTQLPNPCAGPKARTTFGGQGNFIFRDDNGHDIAMFDIWNPQCLGDSRHIWLPVTTVDGKPAINWQHVWKPASAANLSAAAQRFEAGNGTFLLNGKPFVVKAAELHYPRIPKEYWEQRIQLCKALGMNTICLYTFWNSHEPKQDQFDFTGQNDLREFVKLCEKNGMKVILRPGPYVCAEWEMGGLPWWLLKKKDIRLREQDPFFLERVDKFQQKVAEQVGDLTIANGGPIIMVQVENEYGSYGKDKPYVSAIRDMLRKNFGDDVTLFQCDWSSNYLDNGLDDLIWTMNFGTGANIDQQFASLKEHRPGSPLMCSEFWSGWFDKWGANHETRPAADMIAGIDEMLSKGISFSLYMTHGGTNWGHWAGANSPGFAPDVTSYDYDAPISESGQTTPKYWELRKTLAKYMDGEKQPKVPALIKPISIPAFAFTEVAPLWDNLPAPKSDIDIKTMEEYDQGFGSILYRTTLPELTVPALLTVNDPHDFAQVFVDGKYIGKLDRRNGEKELTIPACEKGAQLDILVEAMGRINFGRAIKDFKGITDNVTLTVENGKHQFVCDLKNWQVYNIEDEYATYAAMKFQPIAETGQSGERLPMGAYRATFNIKGRPSDTFLNFETWGKGLVYVNGHPMGRIWEIGPQQTLYMPGCWLKKGDNEIIVFDILGPREAKSEGLKEPKLDQLLVKKRLTHREEGQNLDLGGEKPAVTGTFNPGNGWQEVTFAPARGRYVCIEALDAIDDKDIAAIAEMYLLDNKGERLSREPWTVMYADSEDTQGVNRSADKTFDLQESTYWQTVPGAAFPHAVVIDLGASHDISGFQYLPRMEADAPGAIKNFKIYVKETPFKY